MENEKYPSEERYQKNNKKVRSIGKIVLIIGIVILILGIVAIIFGFTGFGNTFVNGIESADAVDIDDTQMFKGVFGRFGFGDSRISQIHRQVKNKATGTPQGMYYIQPSLSSDAKNIRW